MIQHKQTKNMDNGQRQFSVGLWDILTVVFVIAGLGFAGFSVKERMTPVPPASVEIPRGLPAQASDNWVPNEVWLPFDTYAPSFSGRDIFKTDEEKLLEATIESANVNNVPIASWGEGYQLIGVMVDNDPRAVVKVLNPPGMQVLSLGDSLGDARLIRVENNAAWFMYEGKQVGLKFETNAQKK